MEFSGMESLGYLPFDQINMVFKKVFTNQESVLNKLIGDIKPAQVRKDPEDTDILPPFALSENVQHSRRRMVTVFATVTADSPFDP